MDFMLKVNQDGCDPDFVWDDYLEDTLSTPAPPTAFSHVEHSLVSSLKIGMKLEVVNPEEEEKCFWVSSVVMICGPLLSLRYLGYGDDRTSDFWFDLQGSEFHPVGWCSKNNTKLYPPKGVRERHANFMSLIVPSLEDDTIPISILEDPESGITPIDQIKPDMLVEVAVVANSESVWPAKIIRNVGGRLLLRHVYTTEVEDCDFWLFYLSERLHPMEWAKSNGHTYQLPPSFKCRFNLTEEGKKELLESCFKEHSEYPFPVHILEPQLPIVKHSFKEKMKLELLDPITLLDFRVATVTKVVSPYYFVVEIDTAKAIADVRLPVCCHASSTNIFPCNWASEHGLKTIPPAGYSVADPKDFTWAQYLSSCKAIAAPKELFHSLLLSSKFEVNMKLEAVNPFLPEQIHVATVEKIIKPLLWIRLDDSHEIGPSHVTAFNSLDILPVGWCVSNSYPLQTPVICKYKIEEEESTISSSATASCSSSTQKERTGGKSWCPKIYFNHCCFTGPLLSKSRLAELPQAIGPGPLHLVMKDVLTRLINIAYKSSRVLKELQISGKPDPKMLQQIIKAKYKGKSYRSTVEFVRNSEQVEEFCRKICIKLDCCPHLFGPNHVGRDCPDDCNTLTKSKFGNGIVKRQKNGNTSSPEDTSEVKRGPGRKRKRKHWRLVQALAANELAKHRERKEAQMARGDSSSPKDEHSPKTSDSEDEPPVRKKYKEPGSDSEQKDQTSDIECSKKEDSTTVKTNETSVPIVKKKGRPLGSTKKAIAASLASKRLAQQKSREEHYITKRSSRVLQEAEQMGLPGNPLYWSIDDVVKYVRSTPCAPMAYLLREQEIDGPAFMMLSLYDVQEFLHLKPEPARKFCSLVEKVKYEFFVKFD